MALTALSAYRKVIRIGLGSLWRCMEGGQELKQEDQAGCEEKPSPHKDSQPGEQVPPQDCAISSLGDFEETSPEQPGQTPELVWLWGRDVLRSLPASIIIPWTSET